MRATFAGASSGTRESSNPSSVVGIVGTLLMPTPAAVGAVAALISKCRIEVEREEREATAHSGSIPPALLYGPVALTSL